MRVCLISADDSPVPLAELLATRHEVTLIRLDGSDAGDFTDARFREIVAEPSKDLAAMGVANEDHRRSAAVVEAIESAFGSAGPDYVEVPDRRAPGLVPMQARRGGSPLLAGTLFGVRLVGSLELTSLHDGTLDMAGRRLTADLEREQLRLADLIVWPGGYGLDAYRRYHQLPFPAAFEIAEPVGFDAPRTAREPRDPSEPLRLLYWGPLQRSGGALDLAEACLRLPVDEWRLTMAGAETETAPGGQSVRLTIDAMFAGDPRLTFEDPPAREAIGDLLHRHDILVVPPRFGVWSPEAVAAMAAGMPVLATPVGGLVKIVEPGVSGWLADDVGPMAIGDTLRHAIEDREGVERIRRSGSPAERGRRLSDQNRILDGYERLLEDGAERRKPGRPSPAADGPLVTGIVPYYHRADHVAATVDSMLAQTHPAVEVIVVNDGSFEQADEVLLDLAEDPRVRVVTQLNGGEASARNLGACLADGEYLVMLDADNMLEPQFVERALAVLRAEPDLAYVTCWLRFLAPDGSPLPDPTGFAVLGNRVYRGTDINLDGDALALLPRRVFADGHRYEPESVAHSDWEFYRALRRDGLFGAVIPERLARYRVLPDSLLRTYGEELKHRSCEEMQDRRVLREAR